MPLGLALPFGQADSFRLHNEDAEEVRKALPGAIGLRSCGSPEISSVSRTHIEIKPRSPPKSSALWRRRLDKVCLSVETPQVERQISPSSVVEGKYKILEKLGTGCAGSVYRAVHLETGSQVAVKTLRSKDTDLARRAREEYELLKNLEPHPNIIRAVDFHDLQGETALVLEYFDGLTLHAVGEQKILEQTASVLCAALFKAVAHLHANDILHRDIKPHNVLVSRNLRDLRLIDFNVAACLDEGPPLTPTGTPQYKAPELVFGEPHTTRSDVWASGMCIFFLLSGSLPQGRDHRDPFASLDPKATSEPVSFSTDCWRDVSDDCKAMLQHCLAVNPEDRPEMAAILRNDSWVSPRSPLMDGLSMMSRAVPGTEALLSVLPYTCQMCIDAMNTSPPMCNSHPEER